MTYERELIHRNAARCLKCSQTITSKHTHDYVRCTCGNIAVDGGCDYLRRIGPGIGDNPPTWEDLSDVEMVSREAYPWEKE